MNDSIVPKWFTIVSVAALIWNLMGVMALVMGPVMNDAALNALTEAERLLYLETPLWANIAFASAVILGALGSLALIMKKSISTIILMVSLLSVLVQMFHAYFISNSWEVFGPGGAIMPLMVIVIACLLVFLSVKAKSAGWIN
ncbi:MAG: hypothetical protein P8H39_02920 [Thalassotalea sp.]|nr:hypothetical protein [Thalassotalea sp.]